MMGEQKRSYLIHVPKDYDSEKPTPVVLALHGLAMDGPKGNLQFPLDEPIPYSLIERIVKLRVKQDSAATKN
jgi:hypothetical protein